VDCIVCYKTKFLILENLKIIELLCCILEQIARKCSITLEQMDIRLSTSDGIPVYRQIANQVKYLVASGRLQPGQELPAIRALAERLVINPNTVIHAYAELEKDGVVVRKHGSGTYVADGVISESSKTSAESLTPKIDSLLADSMHLNLDLNGLLRIILERHAILKSSKKE
jgi:GntR family transcriptional regulator